MLGGVSYSFFLIRLSCITLVSFSQIFRSKRNNFLIQSENKL